MLNGFLGVADELYIFPTIHPHSQLRYTLIAAATSCDLAKFNYTNLPTGIVNNDCTSTLGVGKNCSVQCDSDNYFAPFPGTKGIFSCDASGHLAEGDLKCQEYVA